MRLSVGSTTTVGMTGSLAGVVHTTTGNYRRKRVGWETKRHPESGNSLSAYHHLSRRQMMALPKFTPNVHARHSNNVGAV
jgi:hypothetical protein